MNRPDSELVRECNTLTAYLSGHPANEYVTSKFADAHEFHDLTPTSRFERHLLWFATKGPAFARIADGSSRLIAPRSVLRRKLVLLLAILETTPPYYQNISVPPPIGLPARIAGMVVALAGTVLSAAVGLVWFLPVRLLSDPTEGDN